MYTELVKAIFDRIENEYDRLYWNKNHKELQSPFKNTGESYENDTFRVHAYDWDEDGDELNFKYKNFYASWYKHSHRGLEFWRTAGDITADFLNQMLNDCLASLYKDFRSEGNKGGSNG